MRVRTQSSIDHPRYRRGHVVPGLKKYSLSLDEHLIDEIDAVAQASGKSRSITVEILVRSGLKQMHTYWRNNTNGKKVD